MKCKRCDYSIDETMDICPKCEEKLKEGDPKKKSNLPTILIIVSIFLVGCAGIWFFFERASSPKNVMMSHFAKISEKFSGYLENETIYSKFSENNKNTAVDFNIEASIDKGLEFGFETLKLKMNYIDRPEEKRSKFLLELLLDQGSLLKLDGAFSDQKAYFKIPEAMKNYYEVAMEYVSLFEGFNIGEYEVFGDIITEVLRESIHEKDIRKENVNISLSGKDTKLKKYSYTIDKNVMKSLVEGLTTKIKANDKALNILIDLMDKNKDEVIKMLENATKELDKVVAESFDLVTYVRGMNEVVITEIASRDVKLQYLLHDQTEGFILQNTVDTEKQDMTITWVKNKDVYKVEGKILDVATISGTIKTKEKGSDIDLVLAIGEQKLKLKFALETKEIEKNKKYESRGQGTVTFVTGGLAIEFGLKTNMTLTPAGEINLDLAGAKNIETLSENDIAVLQQELMENPLFQLLMGLMYSPDEFY